MNSLNTFDEFFQHIEGHKALTLSAKSLGAIALNTKALALMTIIS
jgi:hypothetical protein